MPQKNFGYRLLLLSKLFPFPPPHLEKFELPSNPIPLYPPPSPKMHLKKPWRGFEKCLVDSTTS